MRALVFAGFFSLAACSAKSATNDTRSCPQGEPSEGSACALESLRCAYSAQCGATVVCTSGVWQKTTDGCGGDSGNACPSSAPRSGEPCPGPASCPYACGDGGTLTATCSGGSWNLVATGCALP